MGSVLKKPGLSCPLIRRMEFQQLFLLDGSGSVVSKDIPKILGTIKCGPELPGEPLPRDYNDAVMRVLRELRVLFAASTGEDQKGNINVSEKAVRGPITRAVNGELLKLRKNGVTGENLLRSLARNYDQHNLRDWVDRRSLHAMGRPVPRIICSEALV